MRYGIRALFICETLGNQARFSEQWLCWFDHDGHDGRGDGEFSFDHQRAQSFASIGDAMAFWNKQSTVRPLRPDGRPNKPLTAITVCVEPIPEGGMQ